MHPALKLGTVLRLAPFAIVCLVTVIGPWITPFDPRRVAGPSSLPPGSIYWFGTDSSGLDVFSQLVAATRADGVIALMVAVLSTLAGIAGGLFLGMNESSEGWLGPLSRMVARVIDFVQALPPILIGLLAISFYGTQQLTLTLAIAFVLSPIQIRLVRTEVLRVRSEAYLEAARMAGFSEFELTLRHVLPNSVGPALENATILFGVSIILAASFGFLGVGLPPPEPEWGAMIARGASDASAGRWWSAGFPVLALAFTVTGVAVAAPILFARRH
jgi:peptide/nickel transport system permease protein